MSCTNSCGIPDMEDFVGELFEFEEDDARQKPVKERKLKKQIKPKKQKVGLQQMKEFEGEADEVEFNIDTQHFNNVPGTENIFVKTFGCSHNISDSQFMIGQLAEYGYNIVDSIDKADLILINSCTVKNPSQDAFMAMVLSAKKIKKPLVVAGCVPQGDRNIADLSDVSALGVTQIDRVVEVVQETLKGNKVQLLEKKELPSLDLPKIRKNKQIQIIPINSGCLGACTYCKTVFARGKLGSYTPEALSNRVKTVIKEGVKEIWLTSEDTGAYGRDIGTNISELLVSLSKELVQQPHIMMRIGMTNPPYILDHLPTVAKFLNHPRVFSFIHIPVQSGSDVVLEKMNRQYNIANFSKVCEYLLQHVPNVTLATDIICGFPGETHEQFEETIQLVEKYNFPVVNISQFYPRPGTAAANMEKLPTHIVKERSSKITKVFHGLDKLSHMMDQVLRVWINESENIKGVKMLVGHTKNYTKVVIPFEEGLLYSQIMLKVTKVLDWHIEGQIVQRNAKPIEVPLDYMQQMGENLMNEAKHLREKKEARIKQSKAKKQALKLQKKTEEKVLVLSVQQKMIKSENEQSNIQNIQKPFVKEVPVPLPAEKISQVSTKQKTNTTTHYTPLYLGFVLFLISSILYTLGF